MNLPWKETYISSEHLAGEAEARMGQRWTGPHFDWESLLSHSIGPLLNLNLMPGLQDGLGVTTVSLILFPA